LKDDEKRRKSKAAILKEKTVLNKEKRKLAEISTGATELTDKLYSLQSSS
jgi:seryl-tRNA synthetase